MSLHSASVRSVGYFARNAIYDHEPHLEAHGKLFQQALKGSEYAVYANGNNVVLATLLMPGIGHGTPTEPGMAADQGGWDPIPSQTMVNDANAVQDWTNSAGIYGPYYAAKFFGIVP
jgi:hypothetical protein